VPEALLEPCCALLLPAGSVAAGYLPWPSELLQRVWTEIWGFLIFLLYMCGLVPLLCMCCSAAYAGKLRLCMHRSRLTFLSRELDELRQSAPAESDAVLSELRRELEDQIAQVQQELADVRPRGRLQQERELRAALMRGSEESDADMQEIIDEIIALQEAGFDTDDARSRR